MSLCKAFGQGEREVTPSSEAQKCVDLFMLKLAAAKGQAPVPDELCDHVQLGAEMVGGVVFTAETPIRSVGMCAECVTWCQANFEQPQPLSRP